MSNDYSERIFHREADLFRSTVRIELADFQRQPRAIENDAISIQEITSEQHPFLVGVRHDFQGVRGQMMKSDFHGVARHRLDTTARHSDNKRSHLSQIQSANHIVGQQSAIGRSI